MANAGSNTISIYTINQSTGALTAVGTPVATGTNPRSVTVDPTGNFAYVANNTSNTISIYTINQSTGVLTVVSTLGDGTSPRSITVDPSGNFAYVANSGSSNVSVYTINPTTGALIPGTAMATGTGTLSVSVDPSGKYVYTTSLITTPTADNSKISVFSINQATGALTSGTAVATSAPSFITTTGVMQ